MNWLSHIRKKIIRTILLILGIVFLFTINSIAQTILPVGKFHSDSIKIGYPVSYSLSVLHDPYIQVLFPDSGYNFSPFELIQKEYFTTQTKDGKSFDSAVYILRSFQVKTSQKLSLPVFVFQEEDSSSVFSKPDSVLLKEYITGPPMNAEFKEQLGFQEIGNQFNYPHFIAYTSLALLFGGLLYFLFGRAFKRRYRLYMIRLDHNSFLKKFQQLHNDFLSQKEPLTIEQALSTWKAYLARLENKPINTYTTTEIINLYDQEELKEGLKVIDRAIYGGLISDEAEKAIATLRKFSVRLYHKRKREIQHVTTGRLQ